MLYMIVLNINGELIPYTMNKNEKRAFIMPYEGFRNKAPAFYARRNEKQWHVVGQCSKTIKDQIIEELP